jgi:hypothetical protein
MAGAAPNDSVSTAWPELTVKNHLLADQPGVRQELGAAPPLMSISRPSGPTPMR